MIIYTHKFDNLAVDFMVKPRSAETEKDMAKEDGYITQYAT